MVTQFKRGQKARLSDLTLGTDLYVGVHVSGPGMVFDISCFGLDAAEQLSDDRYFIFYNQPKSPEESMQLLGAQAGDAESFRITLDRVPPAIDRLAFTATIDGDGTMSQVAPGYLRIVAGGEEVARYSFDGSEFSSERALMIGDFYRKDGWRFAAVGQGFDGGLAALLRHFGGEVEEEEEAPAPAAPAQPQGGAPGFAPPGAQPAAPPAFAPPGGAAPPAPAPVPSAPEPVPAAAPAPAAPPPAAPAPSAPQPPQQFGQPPAAPQPAAPFGQPPGPPPQPPQQFGQPPAVPQQPQFGQPPAAPQQPQFGQVPQQFGQFPPQAGPAATQQVPQQTGDLSTVLSKYRPADAGQRWSLQNPQLVRVDLGLDGQPVMARQGAMVLYEGEVEFGFKGGGFKRRMVANATGEGFPSLMRCTGGGRVYLAEDATRLFPVELQGDAICVSSQHVLAFDESLDCDVRRIDGHGLPGGSLFALQFSGHGTLVLTTHGEPLVMPVTAMTFADANALVAWSAAAQVLVASQVRLRRHAYPGDTGESTQLQFRGAPGNFVIVQPYEI
ncbi:TerD family protein [Streptomyces sp. DSM 44915]|uniref:TerD family protein n=1 Tax=Streptomyces chisholmiae TaxID=3075540 RepID=A0ABU2JKI5_9ACTN|nr:TerD family protein [Streptomyces sp. DSM 44915]MDT0265499.1 TerD family protein [Streptomyces sp. DSM 44915]